MRGGDLLEPALVSRDLASLRDRLFLSGLAWTALTAGCLALAAWRLRPAYVRQFMEGRDPTAARRASRHPAVGDDPEPATKALAITAFFPSRGNSLRLGSITVGA